MKALWFHDLRSGVRIRLIPGWSIQTNPYGVILTHPGVERAAVAAMTLNADPGEAAKHLLGFLHRSPGWRLLGHRVDEAGDGAAITFRSMVDTQIPGQGAVSLMGRIYLRGAGAGVFTAGWVAPEDAGGGLDPSVLDEVARGARPGDPGNWVETVLVDVAQGVDACRVSAPKGWSVVGMAHPNGAVTLTAINTGEAMLVAVPPPNRYVEGVDYARMQALLSQGFTPARYMDPASYGVEQARAMGYDAEPVFELGPPPTLWLAMDYYRGMGMAPGASYTQGSVLLRLRGEALSGYAWATTYGLATQGLRVWEGALYTATGPRGLEEELLNLLLSIVASVNHEPGWVAGILNRRSEEILGMARARSSALSQQLQEVRREIAHRRRLASQFRETMREIGRTTTETFYANLRSSTAATKKISDALGATWGGGAAGGGGIGGSGAQGSGGRRDVGRFDWAGGATRFFIDYEGRVRSLDHYEEEAAYEIGSDGTLYDEDGNVVGRVYEGYVYDTEGNQVGRLDTGVSDEWAMEYYEQNIPNHEEVLGTYTEDEDTPYFVGKKKKDEED